jgi:signal transduction histidine kinase
MLNKDFKKFIDNSSSCIFILNPNNGDFLYTNKKFKEKISSNNYNDLNCYNLFDFCIIDYLEELNDVQIEIKFNNNNTIINATRIDDIIFCIIIDITNINNYNNHIKILFSELEDAKRKSEMSDKMKSSFLANISHEIRTPLNSIIGFSELLINNKYNNEKCLNIIKENTNILLNTINNIMDLSKILSDQIIMKNNKCVLIDIVNEVYIENKINNKQNIDFILDNDLTNIIIYSDRKRIKQILNNLVSNAIKFTEKGYIKFGYNLEQNVIIFYVKDTGIGINKNDYDYIFNVFTQLDEKDTKKYKGTGLGLSITKKIVNLLGGKIWLESKINVGSTFYFTLPSDYNQKISNEFDNIKKCEKLNIEWKNKKILIIENDKNNSKLLYNLIKKTNTKCDIVDNSLDSLKILTTNKYDLIFMNIKLPIINGYELINKIKEEKIINKTPIIALSIFKYIDNKSYVLENGFDDYINIPIDTLDVIKILCKYLN